MESLHKKAIRHISLSKYNEHTPLLYKTHKLTNFYDTIYMQKATLLHNYRHDRLPDSFSNMFSFKFDNYTNRLRNEAGTFYIIPTKYIPPLQSSIQTWNRIPLSIRETKKTSLFKTDLRNYLISKYDEICVKDKCFVCYTTP